MIPRCKVGKGVTGAVRYALGEGRDYETGEHRTLELGAESRVGWIGGTGFGFAIENREDAELARRIMEFDAQNQSSRTKLCEKDCVHMSLGWRPGETPSREVMEAAAHDALKSIGMGNAKAVFAAHTDEHYAHVHIVASKINPDTGHAYDLKGNFLKLSKWAERYEREHGGVVCSRREEANLLRDAIGDRDGGAVLDLLTQQRSTFTGRDLERVLSKQIKSEFGRAQFAEEILNHPEAVRLSDEAHGPATRYTTKTVLEAEQHVLRAADVLARKGGHQVGEALKASVLNRPEFDGISREQALAFRHATGHEGLALIDGQAGTGKSFTIAAIREAYEAQGYRVVGLGPTHAVAKDMRADGFARADTVHSELFALNNGRTQWNGRTAVMVDEAAMLDTKMMAVLTARAQEAGAKLILVGDDRQLPSINRGGMFGVLKDLHGAAELSTVRRQHKNDDRRAAELMAEGNFHGALEMYDAKGAIHWTRTQGEARGALVKQWAKDSAADPSKSRFVLAYTNDDVAALNTNIRRVRVERGELGPSHTLPTIQGPQEFATGDRVQFTGTDNRRGLYNGNAGTVEKIEGTEITIRLDGRRGRSVSFNAKEFQDFRHGYAGTIYKAQGRTLDQTYLYHSEHWRAAPSYVALTRHRDKAELFVARNTAEDVKQLGRQMARVDERRAASHFYQGDQQQPVRPLSAAELSAWLSEHQLTQRKDEERLHRLPSVEQAKELNERSQRQRGYEPNLDNRSRVRVATHDAGMVAQQREALWLAELRQARNEQGERKAERDAATRAQETIDSQTREPESSAEKDGKDIAHEATKGEVSDNKAARISRLMDTFKRQDAQRGRDNSRGGNGGGGRTR